MLAIHHKNPMPIEHTNLKKIKLDICNIGNLKNLILNEKPEYIVHMAALGDVDLCEKDKNLAWKTTAEPSITLSRYASKAGSFILYLSTDYVFDGEKGNYSEDEPPNPINYYGLVKMVGEVASKSSSEEYAIVRTSSIYGLGPGRINFAKFLVEKLKKGERVKALIDQYTSPTHAQLLGEAIFEILEKRLTGIFHVVGERMSRYEFALKLAETLNFNKDLIEAIEMKNMKWIAKRPRDSSLNAEKTRKLLKTSFYLTDVAFQTLKNEYEELRC